MMTISSESKTAEFARLFNLFERLASRKARTLLNSNDTNRMADTQPLTVPADLVPVVNSLAGIVGLRGSQDDMRHQKKIGCRPRRNTVATTCTNSHDVCSDDEDDEESLAKFPLGKKYPFTFKLMLHKLYQLDDWARKVKDVLERSQVEYKPLAERASSVEVGEGNDEPPKDGHVHFRTGVVVGSRKQTGRLRSHSVSVLGKGRDVGSLSPPPKSPRSTGPVENTRAVKKRCVGRRKSMSGSVGTDEGRIGSWVYDAAVSFAELTERRDEMTVYNTSLQRSDYQNLNERVRKLGRTRHASISTPAMVDQPQWSIGGISTRRRALSVMDNRTPVQVQRRQMKRALEL